MHVEPMPWSVMHVGNACGAVGCDAVHVAWNIRAQYVSGCMVSDVCVDVCVGGVWVYDQLAV
jgi:hypothetical protein